MCVIFIAFAIIIYLWIENNLPPWGIYGMKLAISKKCN